MTRLDVLLACPHYPAVSPDPRRLSPVLARLLDAEIGAIRAMTVASADDGWIPDAGVGDALLLSGPALDWPAEWISGRRGPGRLIRDRAAAGQPVLAVWHGEHVLHSVLAGAGTPPPGTPPLPFCIRNPLETFGRRDRLHAWSAAENGLVAIHGPGSRGPCDWRALFAPSMAS